MSPRYAEGTSVSVVQSRAELEATLTRYGASAFASLVQSGKAAIMFEASGRRVLFELPLPRMEDFATVTHSSEYRRDIVKERTPEQKQNAWEQACRQRWRALNLVVKAKLEAVESGITTFEDEFLAHIVLPDGKTVGKWFKPQLEETYSKGKMPPMLMLGSG